MVMGLYSSSGQYTLQQIYETVSLRDSDTGLVNGRHGLYLPRRLARSGRRGGGQLICALARVALALTYEGKRRPYFHCH